MYLEFAELEMHASNLVNYPECYSTFNNGNRSFFPLTRGETIVTFSGVECFNIENDGLFFVHEYKGKFHPTAYFLYPPEEEDAGIAYIVRAKGIGLSVVPSLLMMSCVKDTYRDDYSDRMAELHSIKRMKLDIRVTCRPNPSGTGDLLFTLDGEPVPEYRCVLSLFLHSHDSQSPPQMFS